MVSPVVSVVSNSSELSQSQSGSSPITRCSEKKPEDLPLVWKVQIGKLFFPVWGVAQGLLWKFDDKNCDHRLDVEDIEGNPSLQFTKDEMVAQIYVSANRLAGSSDSGTPEDYLLLASAVSAIQSAHEMVVWLRGLSGYHMNGSEHEFPSDSWTKIENELNANGEGYVEKVEYALSQFGIFVKKSNLVKGEKVLYPGCNKGLSCNEIGISYWLNLNNTPLNVRPAVIGLARDLAEVLKFANIGEIECEGAGCPGHDESSEPWTAGPYKFIPTGIGIIVGEKGTWMSTHESSCRDSVVRFYGEEPIQIKCKK